MANRPFKTVLFALLALLLSAGHSVCASLLAPVADSSVFSRQIHTPDNGRFHSAHGPQDNGQKLTRHGQQPSGPDESSCEHCQTAQYFKTAQFDPAVAIAGTNIAKVTVADAFPEKPATIMSHAIVAAFLRRGPPGDTPVSLKTTLLI